MTTKIEWCDETWNPITGCTPISEGCDHCYAKRMANRLKGRFGYPEDNPFKITLHKDKIEQPTKWKKPRRIFVCSMGDLFHDDVRLEDQISIFSIMTANPRHTFIILTKRPENMRNTILSIRATGMFLPWFKPDRFDNIWLGVTAENQKQADIRIPILLEIPAVVRFVSVEPMLGPVVLPDGIDWIICGKETGSGARPIDIDWVSELRDQCSMVEVPFFYKNDFIDGHKWGEFPGGLK